MSIKKPVPKKASQKPTKKKPTVTKTDIRPDSTSDKLPTAAVIDTVHTPDETLAQTSTDIKIDRIDADDANERSIDDVESAEALMKEIAPDPDEGSIDELDKLPQQNDENI